MKYRITLLLLIFVFFPAIIWAQDYAALRRKMVEEQIIGRGIYDRKVIGAMLRVPRHLFVPPAYRSLAYTSRALPIGEAQTIPGPYIVALMIQLLQLNGDEKVLEIGTGSGYQTAVLAEIVRVVYTVEIIPQLARSAAKRLKGLGYTNVFVKCGNGWYGWEEFAPFDAIIVTCAPKHIPQRLVDQLADGGRVVIPLGDRIQKLTLIEKKGGRIKMKFITDVSFVSMIKQRKI